MKSASPYLLLLALFVSDAGLGITQMYTMIWVYEETGSNFYLALHACTLFGSGVLGALIYALPVFRKDLLKLMIGAKLLMGLYLICLAFHLSLTSLYLFLALLYVTSSLFIPSAQALLPMLTPSDEVQRWNTFYYMNHNLSLCLGWLLGPLIFPLLSYQGVLILDSLLSLACVACLLCIRCLKSKADTFVCNENICSNHGDIDPSFVRSATDALNIPFVLTSFGAASLVFSVINSLEMGIFSKIYQIDEQGIACFFIAWVIGGGIAGIVQWKKQTENLRRIFLGNNFLLPLCTCALIIPGQLAFSLIVYGMCGFFYGVSQLLSNYFVYVGCDSSDYAVVFNKKNLIANLVFLLSSPAIGLSADWFSIHSALLMTCLMVFLFLLIFVKLFYGSASHS